MIASGTFHSDLLRRLPAARQGRPAALASAVDEEVDEIALFTEAQADLLASRGLVWMTDLKLHDGRYATVVAASHEAATRIAQRRGHGEAVVGLMGSGFLLYIRRWMRNLI